MKKIALLFGGRSREHEVSLASASYLLSVLSQLPNPLYPIGVTKDGQMLLYRGSAQELLSKEEGWQTASVPLFAVYRGNAPLFFQTEKGERFSPDAVFSVIHGTYGEDGALQGALTLAGIPFFGADTLSSALGMHKALAKAVVSAVGVPVVPFQSIFLQSPTLKDCEVAARAVEDAFGFPVFIKPCVSGSSLGASLVRERSELKKALLSASLLSSEILAEEYIKGSEIEVAVWEENGTLFASTPAEILSHSPFYDYEAKYGEGKASVFIPARLSQEESERVALFAKQAFLALRCRHLVRVDFLKKENGALYFNEINTSPGFTKTSMVPRLLSLASEDTLLRLVKGWLAE